MSHGFTINNYNGVTARPTTLLGRGEPGMTSSYTPGLRSGFNIPPNASAHTKGNWVGIARTQFPVRSFMLGLAYSINRNHILDVATGEAGAESVLIPNLFYHGNNTGTPIECLMFGGFLIPAGTQISVRAQCGTVPDNGVNAYIALYNSLIFPVTGTPENFGSDTATTGGVSITTAINAYGSPWIQIGSNSASDHYIWTPGFYGNSILGGGDILIQIGYGPNNGAVTLMGTFQMHQLASGGGAGQICPPVLFCYVPSGSGIWGRAAGPSATSCVATIIGT